MMSEKAIRELTDSELNEVTGGFFDPVSVGLGIMVGLDAIVLINLGAQRGVFDAIPYEQWFDK
jgi:bacteriocin-like protein